MRVTANNNWFPMTKFIVRNFFPCCAPDSWKVVFERAPEPSDIYWENMAITDLGHFCREFIGWTLSFALIAVSFLVIYFCRSYLANSIEELEDHLSIDVEHVTAEFDRYIRRLGLSVNISYVFAGVVTLINTIMPIFLR